MPRAALTQEKIVQACIELSKEQGLEKVSFPRLAEYFSIKAPSLYNHFKNMGEVRLATAIQLQKELNQELTRAMIGKKPIAALETYALTYKSFAEKYSEVYDLLNIIHESDSPELEEIAIENIRLIRVTLENFKLTDEEIYHRSRLFRSSLHGFITLSRLGYFQKAYPAEDSFDYMLKQLLGDLGE
ncbi:TetR/AcrR family transcriptional regulator [Lactococcus termiticola]|uniref:TetR family transcriptional regulator n=1 Tax=Lactococcus termiticola TaxID=2169526 RepID=A0A2R5HFQ1_9LACT|nr:TetR/AcrR family transcriptional regulator [Lactococcus termiticola]GBG96822.1 TetR family transcriptional regulator [Lactococcus termiticola]